jgi:two-component system cell cycle response regulator
MSGHVLIVDKDPARRAGLRSGLAMTIGRMTEVADPADMTAQIATGRPDIVLLDVSPDGGGLEALRRLRAWPKDPPAVIALADPDRPELRLAALHAGAEDVLLRDVPQRILQARLRSALRNRQGVLDLVPRDEETLVWSGLSEAPAAFDHGAPLSPAAPSRPQVGLLPAGRTGASPPPEAIARLLDAEVTRLTPGSEPEGPDFDLVIVDAAGVRGDLAEGAQVLSLLSDLRGRKRTRNAATLVLLPGSAVETAALMLDLGANDVVAGAISPREIALRARALVSRSRLREALRDRVREGFQAAVTDPLTGLHNRRHAESALRRMAEVARLSGRGLTVMMLDIDHFKDINDVHGHAAGDHVLIEIGRRLRAGLRPTDLLARVGGEEFLVGIPEAGHDDARLVADRLREAVAAQRFQTEAPPGDRQALLAWTDRETGVPQPDEPASAEPCPHQDRSEVPVTVSIGLATASASQLAAGLALADLLGRADRALYMAKRNGRNTVATAPEAA